MATFCLLYFLTINKYEVRLSQSQLYKLAIYVAQSVEKNENSQITIDRITTILVTNCKYKYKKIARNESTTILRFLTYLTHGLSLSEQERLELIVNKVAAKSKKSKLPLNQILKQLVIEYLN